MKLQASAFLGLLSLLHPTEANNPPNIVQNATILPNRPLANLTVPATPIVLAAESYARSILSPPAYAHVMRSWLYGVLTIHTHPELYSDVDMEVHAVGVLLHDLGWDRNPGSQIVSKDKRFEVDGAIAARQFIREHIDGAEWDEIRVQRVWDAIALHTEVSIVSYKELDVRTISLGITMDFLGPEVGGVSEEAYAEIGRVFPKDTFFATVNDTMIWLCRTKPQTTIDTWVQAFGEEYVEGYTTKGRRAFDVVMAKLWP